MNLIKFTKHQISTRWKNTYYKDAKWHSVWLTTHLTSKEVFEAIVELEELNPPDLYDKIAKIIGNGSWTSRICSECHKSSREPMVSFDNGEYQHLLCIDCINQAKEMLK